LSILRAFALLPLAAASCLYAADPSPQSPWGTCSSAEWFGEYPRFNPMLAQAGVRWSRFFPEWSTIQPKADTWNWKPADDYLADAAKNGIGVSGGFWYFAKWATTTGDTRTSPIKDLKDWSAYVTASVSRYKDRITDWEVYNEFNGSFSNSKNKPKEYADLVVAAYGAAKQADPKARIGISCANFDLGFFDGAIKAGAGGHFDFLCVHPYENTGSIASGGEDGFLSMAGSIRKLLADNKQRSDIALWITEFGIQSTVKPDAAKDALQAEVLVKSHVMALAQGFERLCWFEARGPSYGHGTDHGIIRQDWTLRPCYDAFTVMTGVLGEVPRYVGWLNLADGGYGFVFEGAKGPVLSAWSSKGVARTVTFSGDVHLTDVAGKDTPLPAGQALKLGSSPLWISGVPGEMLALAQQNAGKPFPWGGDFSNVSEVSCTLGATNTEHGITQRNPQTTPVVNMLDHSFRRSNRKDGEGHYAYFRVDPQFASFGTKDLEITVVARRAEPGKASAINICYESLKGYRGTGSSKPMTDDWTEYTWKVDDANFVGGWGWNFRTDIGGSPGDVAIREVRVKKNAAPAK
jgi:polysaccharide biosynthesis protein PslG